MAKLFDMYKGTDTPDIYNQVKSSRQESEANSKKTTDTAFGMLKKSNVGTLQQEYRAGTSRFKGITDPDKKFQVYYDALKALDPQAAQDAAKVYGEERQRRINREIADAYKTSGSTGNAELGALDTAIRELEADIATTEATNAQAKVEEEQVKIDQEPYEDKAMTDIIANTTPEQARAMVGGESVMTLDTGRINKPFDTTLTPDEGKPASELQQDWSKLGAVPLPKYDLRRMYGLNPNFDISLSRGEEQTLPAKPVDIRAQQTPTAGMEDYLPMSRYNNYQPAQRRLASMYRGI